MELVNSILSWALKKRIHDIELFIKYPQEVQTELLKKLLAKASNTEWGKRYKFNEIDSHESYINRVPIQDYDSIKRDILRIKQGEQNILWPTEIKWFAKSSGTTSDKSKFIPVSKEALEDCHYKAGKDLLALYLNNRPDSKLFTGKGVVIGGSSQINQFSKNSYYGDLSSIIIRNLPYWAEYVRIPSVDVALNPKWEEKLETMAKLGPKENVTSLSGVPSWNLVLLKRILEITGKSNMLEVWPNFELYAHGGVSFAPYKKQYETLFPSEQVQYIENYNASEGYIAIQDDCTRDDMLLMLDYGIYYEFMPMAELGKEHPKTLSLSEVETDTNYALVLSTNGGLWRYLIGDTVKFTTLSPYRVKITGRTKQYINAFGEELIVDNAESALEIACKKTGAIVKEYTAGPMYMDEKSKGGHEWLIEFDKMPESLDFFVSTLDNALKTINSDYEAKRYQDIALISPKVIVIPRGLFYKWMEKRGKLGGQHKIPRLSNERKYIEEIKILLEKAK